MFLSIKKHLDGSALELNGALLQLCHALLRSMRLHVVRGEEAEMQRFQSAVLDMEQRIGASPETAEVTRVTAEAARTFEEHCSRTNRFLQVQSAELATMIGMLTATVSSISDASQSAVDQLARVEKRIEKASKVAELPLLKAELADCLAIVREESMRQREQTAETIHKLQRGVSDSQQRLAEVAPSKDSQHLEPLLRDPLTALPARADAENALLRARGRKNTYLALLPVDRLDLVNSRFGSKSTDIVVKYFANYVHDHLLGNDELFRWSNNAFLALVERPQPLDTVRADLSRFASAKLELTLDHHGREILLPISSSWVLLSAREGRSHEALVQKIDNFLKDEVHLKDSF